MNRFIAIGILLFTTGSGLAQTFLDLSSVLDTDAFLEPNGTGLGDALDNEGRRIDATTLPPTYADGTVVVTDRSGARFRFGPLDQASLDSLWANGQVMDVLDGQYESLDLAWMAVPGAFAYPFGNLELRYTDGSKDLLRLGPLPGWFNSPTAFDHTLYRFTDASQVQTLVSFRADFSDTEAAFIAAERGNGNAGGTRFVDGTGYILYRIGDLAALQQATLGVTVGNNFVISIATEFYDPDFSTTEGYTIVADSMVLHDGLEHRALGNLKQYNIDLAPFLAQGTGEIYVLLTDATTANGWGPYIQQVLLYTGTARTFEQAIEPVIDTSQATVHAMFRTGTDAEKPFLYDNSGSGPSNRGHRFADGSGSITYRFDLPDTATQAKLTMDIANNFVVSISGPSELVRYASVTAATPEEKDFLVDEGGSITGGDFRFADASSYMIYQFDLPDDVTSAFAKVHVGNQFVIEASAGTDGPFTVEKDWFAETGEETRDISNLTFYYVDLAPYLRNNPEKVVQIRLSDGLPGDGWGPYLKSIVIQNRQDTGQTVFTKVLDAQEMYGEDIRTEYNKKYYTIDLASVLANNPKRELLVRFTDGSVSDGWGPGIFWMAVHTGDIRIQSDDSVFTGLKTTLADPVNYGLALLHRRYPANSAKTLATIALPAQPETEDNRVLLFAATLNGAAAPPTLSVALAPGNQVRLSWPAGATGYRLESASNLERPISWIQVQNPPQTVGAEIVVEISPTGSARYFRLAK